MKNLSHVDVMFNGRKVGTLAKTGGRSAIAFQYSRDWLNDVFSVSPIKLDFNDKVQIPPVSEDFAGLFGVFHESLPDSWGNKLLDLRLSEAGIAPSGIGTLDRLAIMQENNRGALYYLPEHKIPVSETEQVLNFSREYSDMDFLAGEINEVLSGNKTKNLDTLFNLGGSSGGTRPKVNYRIHGEEWLVKFPGRGDSPDIGLQEYVYARCAQKCGVNVPETALLPSGKCAGYFAVKRFDRDKGKRIHMVSAAGLINKFYYCDPAFDYQTLFALTMKLTDNFRYSKDLYRLMCFNVYSHNQDDHAKNFSFLYDTDSRSWKLAPAYDLTYCQNAFNAHATYLNGRAAQPELNDLLALAEYAGISKTWAKETAEEIKENVVHDLSAYIKNAIN